MIAQCNGQASCEAGPAQFQPIDRAFGALEALLAPPSRLLCIRLAVGCGWAEPTDALLMMRFLSHLTSKSHSKGDDDHRAFLEGDRSRNGRPSTLAPYAPYSSKPNPTAGYSQPLLQLLMSYVCPHSQDDTFLPCEESMIDGGCMLCDIRDLSLCALVNKQWSEAAQNVL